MIFTKMDGEVIVFPYGSEAQQSWEEGIKVLAELFQQYRKGKLKKRIEKEEKIKAQIEECDKKLFQNKLKRSKKVYNLIQTATILGVHRQTIYYWIKKEWVKPKRDHRNYPVFTVLDTRLQTITY